MSDLSIRVLGLDLSTKETGWAIARTHSSAYSLVASSIIRLRGVIPGFERPGRERSPRYEDIHGFQRIRMMRDQVVHVVEHYCPLLVIIEHYAFASPKRTYLPFLAEATGMVKDYLWRYNIPYICVPASTQKKFATGKGVGPKEPVIEAANRLIDADTGVYVANDNEADAIMLAAFGVCILGSPWVGRKSCDSRKWPDFAVETCKRFNPENTGSSVNSVEEIQAYVATKTACGLPHA